MRHREIILPDGRRAEVLFVNGSDGRGIPYVLHYMRLVFLTELAIGEIASGRCDLRDPVLTPIALDRLSMPDAADGGDGVVSGSGLIDRDRCDDGAKWGEVASG